MSPERRMHVAPLSFVSRAAWGVKAMAGEATRSHICRNLSTVCP